MAKKESTFLNMVLTLFLVTGISALALGLVYNVTKEPIEMAKLQRLKDAINIVIPGADAAQVSEEIVVPAHDGTGDLLFYEVHKDGELMGTAIRSFTSRAFSGYMSVMVGLAPDGTIIDSNVLEHLETPGLGDKTCKTVSDWNEQYVGKNPGEFDLRVKQDGGQVDAITAATITARGYSDAIQRAFDTYMKYISEKDSDEHTAEVTKDDSPETDNINNK